ncbi:MAG: hypothetical protein QXP04_03965 [Candidatus Nanoarchaeia archaeon]|nr:hypothetical protein [Candidatus Jingweiarchaeum tengchongense]
MGRWDNIKDRFKKVGDRIRGRKEETPPSTEKEEEGKKKEEEIPERRGNCPKCGGRGVIVKVSTCKNCGGTGKVHRWVYDVNQRKWVEGPLMDCPNCESGQVIRYVVCSACKGTGMARVAAWGLAGFLGKRFAMAIPWLWKFIGVFVISWAAGYFFGWWPIGVFVFILAFLIMDLPIFIIWGPTLSQSAPWLRFLLMYGSLMGIFWFLVWPLIMGYVGGFFPIIGRSFTQLTAAGKKQSDILRSLDFQAYVHQQEAMWEFQEAPTQTSPTAGLSVKKFDVVPSKGCFDLTTYQVISQIQNNAPYDIFNVTVRYANPLSTKLGGWEEEVFNTLVAIVLFNPTFSLTSYFYCEYLNIPNEQGQTCGPLRTTKLGPNEIILHSCPEITVSDPGAGRTFMNCPLSIIAEADFSTTSISYTQFINDTYAHVLMMQNMFSQQSVPATSSRGPILLNIDPGPQPILAGPNSSDKMTVVVSFSNKGSGEITELKELCLVVPKILGSCKGDVFKPLDFNASYCSGYNAARTTQDLTSCTGGDSQIKCEVKAILDYGFFIVVLHNTNKTQAYTISNLNVTLDGAPTNETCKDPSVKMNLTRNWYGVIDKDGKLVLPIDKKSIGIGLCPNTTYSFIIEFKYTDKPSQTIDQWNTIYFTVTDRPYSPICEFFTGGGYLSKFINEVSELGDDYNVFCVGDGYKLKEFGLYPCTLDADGKGLRSKWSEINVTNRRSLLFRADIFYRYATIQDAYIDAHLCQSV